MSNAAPYAIAVALLLAGGFWSGREWEQGQQAEREAEERAAQDARAVEVASDEAARLAEERSRMAFAQQMEDAAYAEPVVFEQCLPVERVQRLQQRGRAAE